ncbi:MAG: BrnT family toxin [Elsteraceae bacterium]
MFGVENERAFDTPYVWDEGKRASNISKHGVGFAEAARRQWDTALTAQDIRRSDPEPRLLSIGLVGPRV